MRTTLLAVLLIAALASFLLVTSSLRAAAFTAGSEAELVTAINNVNSAGAGTHVITITADISLTAALPSINNPAADAIIVAGGGHTLTGDGAHTVLAIAPQTIVAVEQITVTNGVGSSGSDGGSGGALHNQGTLSIIASTLTGNSAVHGGAVLNEAVPGINAAVDVISSTLSLNTATNGGAIANISSGGDAFISTEYATVSGNTAAESGGAIFSAGTSTGSARLSLARSEFAGNDSTLSGGAVMSTVEADAVAKVTILRSQFNNNSAGASGGALAITSAGSSESDATLVRVTFAGNEAVETGGGIYQRVEGGDAEIVATSVTLSANEAGTSGGAIHNSATTGAATVRLTHATVALSTAPTGSAMVAAASGGSANIILGSSIVAGATPACAVAGGAFFSNGFNTASDASCGLTSATDLTGVDAKLQPLADNAPGDTPTHALAADSPAVDRVTYTYNGCGTQTTIDQRGAARLQGIKCDSGAYELDQPALDCTPPLAANSDATLNRAILCANQAGPGTHTIDVTGDITLAGPATPFANSQATATRLTGNGHTIDGAGKGTVFVVRPDTSVVVDGLVVTNGAGSNGSDRRSGGAFYVTGALELANTTITNSRANTGGGIFLDANLGTVELTVTESLIADNEATVTGGGMAITGNEGLAQVSIANSEISGNTSGDMGGGLAVSGRDGTAEVSVVNTTIAGNSAKIGGGLFNNGNGAGGISQLSFTGSTISGNSATGSGGALVNNGNNGDASIAFLNSTISTNSADKTGGAIINTGNGGTATLSVRYSTIANNSAPTAGTFQSNTGATATFIASILADPATAALCDVIAGSVASGGFNIATDDSCGLSGASDVQDGQPDLQALALNLPGTTRTHALGAASDALDHIPAGSAGCGSDVVADQRGVTRPRPAGGQCDSGAYEVGQNTPPPPVGFRLYLPAVLKP